MNAAKTITATFTAIEYTLSISATGSGSVAKSPSKATYHYGDVVQLTASPAAGYSFSAWSGDVTGSANPASVTVNGNKAVTATFTQNQYALTVSTVGSGSVLRVRAQTSYTSGTVVTLTASPSAGYTFTGWSGDLTGSVNPATITMNAAKTVTATFTAIEYTFTVSTSGSGSVAKSPSKTTYHYGDVVQLTATPITGWTFSAWSGDVTGSANPASMTVNGNKAVTATFTQNQYTLDVPIIGSGSVAKSPSKTTYIYGETVQLTATPAAGYTFTGWSGDLTGSVNPATITMNAAKTVTATFDQAPLLVDSTFSASADSAALRANSPSQDWYESRNDVTTLLTLDTNNIGGNTGKKAGFSNGTSGGTYLSQEFTTPQTGIFTAQWDIYVDSIIDITAPDRAGMMLIGSDSGDGPNRHDTSRFVYLGFYKNGGGTTGTMDLVAMTTYSSFTSIASNLNLKQWYTIKVVVDVPSQAYDVYIDGALITRCNRGAGFTGSSLTYISFARWNDGQGDFYVDNVYSPAPLN